MPETVFENEYIRQGILLGNEFPLLLRSDRDRSGNTMQVSDILREIMGVMRWKQSRLAVAAGVTQGTISKWLSGQQTPNLDQWAPVMDLIRSDPELAHLRFSVDTGSVGIMGRVGAGAIIEPDFEQIPPEGLYSVTLPFPVPAEMVGFVIEGDSMYPYEPGHVIIVYKEQRKATLSYAGTLVAVRTEDGRRYLKKLWAGTAPDLYRLESFNAAPMHDVSIAWVGEIFAHLPATQVFQVEPKPKKATGRRRTGQGTVK